jgi:hypothetical protein
MKIENGIFVSVENSDIVNGKFVVPEGITRIGDCAFYGCTGLRPATKKQRKEILAIAKSLLPGKCGLCACLDVATREYSLQKRMAFSVCSSFHDFTRENAMQFVANKAGAFWWPKEDKESRIRFLEWLEKQ